MEVYLTDIISYNLRDSEEVTLKIGIYISRSVCETRNTLRSLVSCGTACFKRTGALGRVPKHGILIMNMAESLGLSGVRWRDKSRTSISAFPNPSQINKARVEIHLVIFEFQAMTVLY